jgi:predicted enzyme related to lactoylglutathione lyase
MSLASSVTSGDASLAGCAARAAQFHCARRKKDRMRVTRFSSAYYVVKDMERAVRFYSEVLGLDMKFRDGARWAQFDVGGVAVALADPSEGAISPGGGATVVLEVEDLGKARESLIRSGASVSEVVEMGGHGRYFTLEDPDGNVLQVFARSR